MSNTTTAERNGNVNRLDALETKVFDVGGEIRQLRSDSTAGATVYDANFAVIRFPVLSKGFRLSSTLDLPNFVIQRISHRLARETAIELNADVLNGDRRKSRWHFIVPHSKSGRCSVVWVTMPASLMPNEPDSHDIGESTDFAVLSQSCIKHFARTEAESLNRPILAVAKVPSVWHIAVRSLRDVPQG